MGRATGKVYDAGNHRAFERRSHRQAARRGRLTQTRPTPPEIKRDTALLHHVPGHDQAIGIWILLSLAMWLAIGELVVIVSGWGGHSIDADTNDLSKIAPAAGQP